MQSAISDSIKGNIAALQTLCLATGSLALLLIWGAFQNHGSMKLFGIDSDRDKVYLTAGLFLSASNIAQALYYRRLSTLTKMVTHGDDEKTFYSIVLSPSLLNPFTVFGPHPERLGLLLVPFVAFLGLSSLWSIRVPSQSGLFIGVFLMLVSCAAVMMISMLIAVWSVANLHATVDPTTSPKARRKAVIWSAGGVVWAIVALLVLDWLYDYIPTAPLPIG